MAQGYVYFELENKAEFMKRLDELEKVKPKRGFQNVLRDMRKRGATLFARIAAQQYAVKQSILKPTTKAGAGKASLSMVGFASLGSINWVYRGERLHIGGGDNGSFTLKPQVHTPKKRYTLKTRILRGGLKEIGHYNMPYSEGGRFGARSPHMVLPGITVPIRRQGEAFGGGARGLSVPQMILSARTSPTIEHDLSEIAMDRVMYYIQKELGS